ncbi:MAG TPA: hypothetical protein VNR36_09515 [Pseudolysinimonas sp.]|nr:hypothetical protein [Pseudolysinimonas sp.]
MKQLPDLEPVSRTRTEGFLAAIARGVRRVRPLRAFLLWPVFTRPGYWFATGSIFVYGLVLGGRFAKKNGIHCFTRLPKRAYGRGGTTIGAIYLTTDNDADDVLEHEAEHKAQWKRYGLWFIPLYVAAGSEARTNRFEVAAGLELGGYLRKRGEARNS